jgi:hypothetical protein
LPGKSGDEISKDPEEGEGLRLSNVQEGPPDGWRLKFGYRQEELRVETRASPKKLRTRTAARRVLARLAP